MTPIKNTSRWSRHLALTALLASLASCGGGASTSPQAAPQEPNIVFQVHYRRSVYPDYFPDAIDVYPVAPRLSLGINENDIAKVEFLLFGHDMQTLTQPNSAPMVPPELRYFFELPPDFKPGVYPCGTGEYVSEVRVTNVAGQVLSQTFELCPGMFEDLPVMRSSP